MGPAIAADVTPAIKAMLVEGAGISVLPDFFVREEIATGKLIRLTPDWALPSGGIYSVYPPTQFRSAATRHFTDMFAKQLRTNLG